MATITERAVAYAKEYDPTYETERAYRVGASTQLHLDMQKMCEFLEAYHNGPVGEKEYLVQKFREYMIDGND